MTFTPEVYEQIRQGCISSAQVVVPRIIEMFRPRSVLDVGGGEGWWAREFAERGVAALCVDPATESYVDDDIGLSRIKGDFFHGTHGTYDLVLCLEVAEHLPLRAADALVEKLVQCGEVVVFSAAIPGQGGHGHINEQWPDFWAGWFREYDYVCSEDLRWWFWDDVRVEPWYRQNLLLFAKEKTFKQFGSMHEYGGTPRDVVHPDIFAWKL